ncbi:MULTISPECIES: phage head morphogenesis protein [Acetobacter]|uniref:Phage head morphogenesis domain-containing protein n=1 Tax=Acetobacter lovaniensis TaxID=104100 RepID=A0A841QGZ8_9PROT|nr:phage minor head protein [Acetobacter lovaniensis]MBB6457453.1 hypothetical protein [Acetobacter lovaniensis]NHN81751.1 hypothetical protein [Acetobacter lovaniensis]GBQ70872.1 phage Mu protein F-like protein [Acetobacter lovaniensis NRIC 0474]
MADTDGASLASALRMPPGKAMEFFRQKLNVPTKHWDDLWHEAHARGFMVAGATSQALLADFRKAIDQAIAGGITANGFRKEFDAIVAKHGWAYNGSAAWRSDTIYSTNMLTAHGAGRYARQSTPEALEMFPYWQYQHHTCQHPRPQHVAWNGQVIRADDPWWNTHYPPNGWKCHCTVRALSEKMVKRMGLTVSSAPLLNARPWLNKRTGETLWVPEGIDPGFAYNPGKAWQEGLAPPIGSRFKAEDAGSVARPSAPPQKPAPSPAPVAHKPEQEETHLVPVPDVHRDDARQTDILRLHKHPIGNVNAGEMPEAVRKALGAQTRTVKLSGETMEKQLHKHGDLTEADYRRLPAALAQPDIVARQGEKRVLFFHQAGYIYRGALKTTGDGAENYLLSFHRTTKEKATKALRDLPILSGSLDALSEADTVPDEDN